MEATENSPLTDQEVCRKFDISRNDPGFDLARRLSDTRPDRTVNCAPEMDCPHCTFEFQETLHHLRSLRLQRLACPSCHRTIYIEHITEEETGCVSVTLCTHPEPRDGKEG